MMIEIAKKLKEKAEIIIPDNPGFGQKFSDHIFSMDYNSEIGWHNPEIKPLDNLSVHPATMFMHYGQAIFEGLKAFKTVDGEPVIFRPEKHFKRLNNSARRICIPEIDERFMLKALIELISVEKDWIPSKPDQSLYIRPLVIGMDPFLGVRPSLTYKCIILLSPVGAYYPEGLKPVNIWVEDKYVRAVRKGLGECKTPANYAASMLAGEEARKNGYTQVLWLDAVEQKYIEEVGTMNIFIRFKDEVVTPKLTGGILPGVTRDSVINILKKWDINITERLISMDEFVNEYNKGNVLGVFGTGTAAVISSVGWLTYKNNKMVINDGKPDDLAFKLYDEITSIQYGKKEEGFNWLTYVEKKGIEAHENN